MKARDRNVDVDIRTNVRVVDSIVDVYRCVSICRY